MTTATPLLVRFLSLSTSVSGFDPPLTRAGMGYAGQVDFDASCRSVLARHFPDVRRHHDIATATRWWQTCGWPAVDLVGAGLP